MIDDLNGHFNYLHTKAICPKDAFKVKSESIDLAKGEYLLGSLTGKRFASALRVGKLEAANERKHLDIYFGSKLA